MTLLEDGKWIWSIEELRETMQLKYPLKTIDVVLEDKQYKCYEV